MTAVRSSVAPDRSGADRAQPGDADRAAGLTLHGVSKVLGGRTIVDDLDLTVRRGELVCLLGPSGCGKTTTLRMIAGFLAPDAGTVRIGDEDVTRLRPEKRPTAMVFQNYALWPHMSVFDNVAFGLKLRKLPKGEISQRVQEMLELVNLSHHVRSRPARISGGEQQRVALARALVQRPSVLLLDEPLSNLDAKLRMRVREDIREIQQRLGITTVIVTHDQDEALSISDRVAVMNSGRIEQYSTPVELYGRPATQFVGGFVGAMNSYAGSVREESGELVALLDTGARIPVETATSTDAGATRVGVRPEDVVLVPAGQGAPATVTRVIPRGHFTEVVVELADPGPDGTIVAGTAAAVPATAGDQSAPVSLRSYVDRGASRSRLEHGLQIGVRWRAALVYAGDTLLR